MRSHLVVLALERRGGLHGFVAPAREAASAPASSRSVTPASAEATTANGPWCFWIQFYGVAHRPAVRQRYAADLHTSQPDFVIDHLKTKGPSPAG